MAETLSSSYPADLIAALYPWSAVNWSRLSGAMIGGEGTGVDDGGTVVGGMVAVSEIVVGPDSPAGGDAVGALWDRELQEDKDATSRKTNNP